MQFHGRRIGEGAFVDGHRSAVLRVMTCDGGEDARAIFSAPGHRTDLVHRRRQRHRAVPADAAVGGPQTAHSAVGRRADDGAPRFRADRKRGQTRGDDGS